MKSLLVALLSASLSVSAAPAKKWNPGHYLEVDQLEPIDIKEMSQAKDVVKGAWVRYNWNSIEQSAGKFDFSPIDRDIATLTAAGFKIGLILEDKAFNKPLGVKCVPADMIGNATYAGGQAVIPNGALYKCVSKRWVTKVSERWSAYLKKVGDRYDSNPNVVMIQNTESAPSYTGAINSVDYVNHLKREANGFATAFPTTPWAMSLNWNVPVNDREPLVKLISSLGGGITHPDSIPPNGQGNQFDSFFVSYKGRIVSAPLAEMTYIDGKETIIGTAAARTWKDHVNFVVNTQGAHFAAWQRYAWGKVSYDFNRDLAPALRAVPTIKSCPSNIVCK